MAINVSRIWQDGKFQVLSLEAKLIYIYLATSPNINTLGLLSTQPQSIQIAVGIKDTNVFKKACRELTSRHVKIFEHGGLVYFVVLGHFETLPKSITVSKRATKDVKELPEGLEEVLKSKGLMPDIEKHFEWNAPTSEEIEKYGISKGYLIDGQKVIDFYESKRRLFRKKTGWYDSKGKAVKDWRAKMRHVWFREENKLKKCEDAPKGFEYFFVKEGEKYITPDHWKNGMPVSNGGFLENKLLQREYKKQKDAKD